LILIAGTIDLSDPDRVDEALERSRPLQQATRDEEPGCHSYVFSADPNIAGRIVVFERWDDEAALAAHFEHPNYLNMRDLLGEVGLAAADNNKYRCDLVEPVYDKTFTPRADFFTS
jgi:quinol monooxygenase YgiN